MCVLISSSFSFFTSIHLYSEFEENNETEGGQQQQEEETDTQKEGPCDELPKLKNFRLLLSRPLQMQDVVNLGEVFHCASIYLACLKYVSMNTTS